MLNDPYQNRKYVISAVIVVVVLIYIGRLFSLQIIETKYKEGAASNALLHKTLYAPRGLIYDRNNNLLVYNKPAYDITVIMRELQQHPFDTLEFCRTLNISKEFFDQRMSEIKDRKKNLGYSSYTPQVFLTQLENKDVATFQQSSYKFNGFSIQNRTLREYKYPNAAHVLGNIGEVSRRQMEADSYYKLGDYAGRDGIEYMYEKELRGEKGAEILLRDAKGRIQGKYADGEEDIPPKAGENLTLTIDIDLQALGERLLTGKIGSIVAIEPGTGEILAMVSNPTFDPSMLVGREKRSKNYAELAGDPTKPLLNRAVQARYSPGSTFKTIQALICLEMGGITTNTYFSCSGRDSKPIACTHWHQTPLNLYPAIEQSCNPFFWQAFRSTLEKDGYGTDNETFKRNYKEWEDHVRSFGFGDKIPGTDIYEQVGGYVPNENFYRRMYGEKGWRAITIRSLAIGQGEISVTPLQLANATAIIANDGEYITPHLVRSEKWLSEKEEVNIKKEYFKDVKEGMRRVMTNTGSGSYNSIPGIEMMGKTGTVQNSHGKDHSIFIGIAPRENPQIAIAVVIENSGFGATWALPISSLMIEQYLTGAIERKEAQDKLDRLEKTVLNPNVKKY